MLVSVLCWCLALIHTSHMSSSSGNSSFVRAPIQFWMPWAMICIVYALPGVSHLVSNNKTLKRQMICWIHFNRNTRAPHTNTFDSEAKNCRLDPVGWSPPHTCCAEGCVGPPTTHTYNAYISSCRTNDIHMRMARNNTWFLLLCSALPLMRCRGHSSQRICYIWFSSLHSSWNWDVYYVCHWHKGQGVLDEGRESKEFQVICSLIRAPRRCYIYRICAERKKEREKGHNAVFDRTMGHMCADRCEMRPASIVWMVPTRPYAADAAVR